METLERTQRRRIWKLWQSVGPIKDNCIWLWYNLWQWGWRRVDRRCVMSLCREQGMFVPFLVALVLLLSDAVKPDNNGGRLLQQNVNYFQVPGMRWLWFGPTFIIPINFMSGHFGMKHEIFIEPRFFIRFFVYFFNKCFSLFWCQGHLTVNSELREKSQPTFFDMVRL